METLLQDIRYGVRGLVKRPGFTAIVLLTLGLGIGASTVIFSVVNSVVLRNLPYRQPDRIVAIQELSEKGTRVQVTSANFLDWRAQNTVFEHLAAIRQGTSNLALSDSAERIDIAQTSANFFDVFGVVAAHGRLFITADEQAGHEPIVVLGHGLWQSKFGGDAGVVGKPIRLDGRNYTVVGVAPAGFQYPAETEAWLPPLKLVPELFPDQDVTQTRGMGYLSAVALLKPGVSLPQAAAEMETITARLRQQFPESNNNRFNKVVSLHRHLIGETDTMLWLLLGAVTFVLLIACANVANLLLANAAGRQKEIAIRTALGASRFRVIRQLFTESALLAFAGGAVGLLLSVWGVPLITRLLPREFPRLNEIQMDWRVLGFTLAASVLTGLLFGLAPAFHITKFGVQDAMKESSHGAGGSIHRSRLRHALIVAEVALSVVLLAGAGLLIRSFMQLQSVNAGFTPEQLLTAQLTPSGEKFRDDTNLINYFDKVTERVAAVPGVREVGVINTLPLQKGPTLRFRIEGRAPLTIDKWPPANYRTVSPNYFHVMNIPVLQGRTFTRSDNEQSRTVLMVNQSLVDKNFSGENVIGRRINFGRTDDNQQPVWLEIVGVVADIKNQELKEPPEPEFYFSTLQNPFQTMSIVVRSNVEPTSLVSAVRQAVAEVDKTVPIADFETMERLVTESVMQPRFNMVLLGLFSGIALLLSAAGIYGVTSYTVTQRTHELGIRLALGAQIGDVLKLILKQGLLVIFIGVAIGLVAAFVLTRLLKTLVFGVSTTDPLTFVGITLLLSLIALIACYVPARRATKVDPLVALRYE